MYNQQSGFFPIVTKLLGLTILVYSFLVILIQSIAKFFTNHSLEDIVITLVAALVVLLFPMWFGLFLIKMFPAIQVITDGIKYLSLGFIKGTIRWNEIEDALLFENGYIAIAFRREGIFLVNGTYFNKMYGMLIRHELAVLFLSPGTANREEILDAIYRNSNVKRIKEIRPRHI